MLRLSMPVPFYSCPHHVSRSLAKCVDTELFSFLPSSAGRHPAVDAPPLHTYHRVLTIN